MAVRGRIHAASRERADAVLLDDPGSACPNTGVIEGIVDRLVRGKDPAQRGLIRSRRRLKKGWAGAG